MEEYFFSGYCKAVDGSRTVTVEVDPTCITADCDYPHCPWSPTCPIAGSIRETTA